MARGSVVARLCLTLDGAGAIVIAQQISNGLALGSIYAMIAVALTLSIGVINFLNFSIPGVFMVSAFVVWGTMQFTGSWLLAILFALLVGGCLAVLVERFTWSWLKNADPFVPLVSSMAFLMLFENWALTMWGSDLKTLPSISAADVRIAGVIISLPQLAGLLISIALAAALRFVLTRTPVGRALRTISEDSEVASILGVNVNRTVRVLFIVSALCAAVAGVLFSVTYRQVHPYMGEIIGLRGISAMVIGGMGNVWGAIIGGILIGLGEVAAINMFGADVVDIVIYGTLLLILAVRPEGLFGATVPGRGRV